MRKMNHKIPFKPGWDHSLNEHMSTSDILPGHAGGSVTIMVTSKCYLVRLTKVRLTLLV
jgi:hypothetical protein